MHDRPPARRRTRKEKREQWRLAKRRQRAREEDGIKRAEIQYSDKVVEALIAQGEDAGLTDEEAGRQSRNRKKVAAVLTDVVEHWAKTYLVNRERC